MPKHAAGNLIGGRHTTLIDIGDPVVEFLRSLGVKIIPGQIMQIRGRRNGKWAVKVVDLRIGVVLLRVSQNSTIQEIRIIFPEKDRQFVKEQIARFVRNNGWELSFGNLMGD